MPTTALDTREQWFLGLFAGDELYAIGGVTPDPYALDANVGRIRRFYVATAARRRGNGRQLLVALEARASAVYRTLRLKTDTTAAAAFCEARGYAAIVENEATHQRELPDRHLLSTLPEENQFPMRQGEPPMM